MLAAMITYQHECGKKFSVIVENAGFASPFAQWMSKNVPQEENEPDKLPDEVMDLLLKGYSELAKAKGSILVNPKETPMIVCDCGGWIDIEQVVKDHRDKAAWGYESGAAEDQEP